jgi:hypothetical protein
MASFTTVLGACKLARASDCAARVRCLEGWGRGFFVLPTDDPHKVYHAIFPEYA